MLVIVWDMAKGITTDFYPSLADQPLEFVIKDACDGAYPTAGLTGRWMYSLRKDISVAPAFPAER